MPEDLEIDSRLNRSSTKLRDDMFMKRLHDRRQQAFNKAFREYHQMRMASFKPK